MTVAAAAVVDVLCLCLVLRRYEKNVLEILLQEFKNYSTKLKNIRPNFHVHTRSAV